MTTAMKLALDCLLEDAPDEAIAYALADSLYDLDGKADAALLYRLSQADTIRTKLRALGFDVVRLCSVQTRTDQE
jgi:hypothetical protein